MASFIAQALPGLSATAAALQRTPPGMSLRVGPGHVPPAPERAACRLEHRPRPPAQRKPARPGRTRRLQGLAVYRPARRTPGRPFLPKSLREFHADRGARAEADRRPVDGSADRPTRPLFPQRI